MSSKHTFTFYCPPYTTIKMLKMLKVILSFSKVSEYINTIN